jgi:peptide/nickel transport system permease protein
MAAESSSLSGALPSLDAERRERYAQFVRSFRQNRKATIGLVLILGLFLTAAFAPVVAPYPVDETNPTDRTLAPSIDHPFGTDSFGRDVFSRVIMGARISLYVGFTSVAIALVLGTPLGVVGGYYSGMVDEGVMRTMDAFMSFPPVMLALVIMAVLGPALSNAILAIAIVYTPYFARVARSAAISVSNEQFVDAAVARGEGDAYIIFREVLPNCLAPVFVQASINIAFAMLVEASLSFLGLGAQPPTPSWGLMINSGRGFMEQAPWIVLFPGLGIAVTVIGFNMLGDGLRDVLDPKVDTVE